MAGEPTPPSGPGSLVERVLSGEDPKLARLAAEGLVPLPPDELVAVQVALARRGARSGAEGAAAVDPELATVAAWNLGTLDPERVAALIRDNAPLDVLSWFARESDDSRVLEAVLRRRDVPRELLAELAAKLSADLQEILLLRQDAIVEHPEILDALETNPELSAYARRRIRELREHLLAGPKEAAPARERERPEDEPSDGEVLEAIEEARQQPGTGTDLDRQTGLSDAQVRLLPVPVRRRLARGASKTLRSILIRDPNAQVAVTALGEGALSDGEVEQIAANRAVVGEVLEEIARHREWMSKQKIVSALVHNPRTPAGVAVRLVPRISVRELRNLSRDRNVSSAVRMRAQSLYRMKRR